MATPYGTPGGVGYVNPFAPSAAPPPPAPVATSTPAPTSPSPTPTFKPTLAAPTYTGPVNNSINNTPQGDALVKSNQDQAASIGVKIPGVSTPSSALPSTPITQKIPAGWTQADYDAFKSTNPNIEPTDEDVVREQLAEAQADYQAQAKTTGDAITNISNGTTPLNPAEQAQVDGLKAQFQTLIDQQLVTNRSAVGIGQIRGAQSGALEYDPYYQARTIGSIVSAGVAKVADLQAKEAAAVAQLTTSFRNDDIKAVQSAWDVYQKAFDERQTALQKTITDTQTAIKDAQDQQLKVQQYNLDVEKFNQTQDATAFDQAFKVEQEQFNEKNKNQTLALEQFKAGMGAGGSGLDVTQSAQLTASGNPDPVSQKQVYDQISAKYGPMTAIAIKNLSDYQMNPADWSSRATKGLTHAQAVTLAQMYDPTYDEKMYSTRAAYQKSLASNQSGTVGSAVNAANKSINHLTAFVNTMNKVNGQTTGSTSFMNPVSSFLRGSTMLNTASDFPATGERRTQLTQATTEGLGVAEELAKFFKGSGTVDVASIDAWKTQVDPHGSPAQVRGTTQGAIDLLTGQLEVLAEQYKTTMGKAPTSDFLNTSARASLSNLKNQGYAVDIPGVNYTDKAAYIKHDSDAQDNLTKAYQDLVNANDPNNPPSPENVLELAQMY